MTKLERELKVLDNEALLNKLVNAAIKLTKEENSKGNLTKKTDKEFQAVYNELLERLYNDSEVNKCTRMKYTAHRI